MKGIPKATIDEMARVYETDTRQTFVSLGREFGYSATLVRKHLIGIVNARVGGRPREDGTPAQRRTAPAAVVPFFDEVADHKARREARRRALDRDPDVLRYRSERKRRQKALEPAIRTAKREFKRQLQLVQERGLGGRPEARKAARDRSIARQKKKNAPATRTTRRTA